MLAALRLELFRTLLMQKIEFFDKHSHTELTSLISVEVDALRSFVFNNVSRDRGLRALLEAVGAVVVLYCLSWRLGPILALVIIATGLTAAMYKRQTKTVEARQLNSLAAMVDVADQAFSNIKTVRYAKSCKEHADAPWHLEAPLHSCKVLAGKSHAQIRLSLVTKRAKLAAQLAHAPWHFHIITDEDG